MALIPFNRKNDLSRGLFKEFFNFADDFFANPLVRPSNLMEENFRVNIQEKDDEYIVEAEMPGVEKEQINLELRDGRLSIILKREDRLKHEGKNYIHRESHYRSMSRTIYLPDAKEEGTRAKLKNGVLKIYLPRDSNSTTGRIEIE